MSTPQIPILSLPTSDYEQICSMNNRRLIHFLRTAVLAPDRVARFSPRPPADHDAYFVVRQLDCIRVNLMLDGRVVFHCQLLPSSE